MKRMFMNITFASMIAMLVIMIVMANFERADTAVTGETLINVQDSSITGMFIKARRVKDAGNIGDNQTSGLLASGLLIFDGTNWDKARGDSTYGLDVDVTRVSGTVTVTGNTTPSDAFANPNNAITTWSLTGMWNGSSWDRIRGDTTNGVDVDVTRVQGTVSTQDTLGSTMTVGQVSVGTTATQVVASNTSRREVMIQNLDASNDIYCGPDNTVTTTSGFKIPAGAAFIDDKYNGAYFCIAAATVTVAYREVQ